MITKRNRNHSTRLTSLKICEVGDGGHLKDLQVGLEPLQVEGLVLFFSCFRWLGKSEISYLS